jgi:hypothetical protein
MAKIETEQRPAGSPHLGLERYDLAQRGDLALPLVRFTGAHPEKTSITFLLGEYFYPLTIGGLILEPFMSVLPHLWRLC